MGDTKTKRFLGRGCAALLLAGTFAAAAPKSAAPEEYRLTISADEYGTHPASQFTCRDKVHLVLKLPRKLKGKHSVRADWYRPDGDLQETTKVPLELDSQDNVLLWLQCHPARVEDAADVFFHSDDGSEFDGAWRVDVSWDGKKVQEGRFTMSCP
jgi:hypothetical protein